MDSNTDLFFGLSFCAYCSGNQTLRTEPVYLFFFFLGPFVETLFGAKMGVFGALLLAAPHLHLKKANLVSCSFFSVVFCTGWLLFKVPSDLVQHTAHVLCGDGPLVFG